MTDPSPAGRVPHPAGGLGLIDELAPAGITPATMLEHRVAVRPLGGRHRTVAVEIDGIRTWVVKRGPRAAIDAEADALARLAGCPAVPPGVARPRPDTLVTPWIASVPCASLAGAPGLVPHAAGLGRVLAALHSGPPIGIAAPPPWILGLHRPSPARIARASAGVVAVTRAVQGDMVLCDGLDALAAGWRSAAATHGDVRLHNVLAGEEGIVLVDWEAAGDGLAAMDLGWFAGEQVSVWTGSMHATGGDPGSRAASAAVPVEAVRPAVAAMWAAYRDAHPRPPAAADVARWAGARLVQAAVEESQGGMTPGASVDNHLAAARAAFIRPEAVAAHLGLG